MPDNPPSLRVLNILFDDRFGGPTSRIIQVARVLAEHGVETVLCLPARDGNAEDLARDAGIPVRRIAFERVPRIQNPWRVLRWIFFLPRDIGRFLKLFLQEKPDIIHVNGAFFIAPAIAAKLAKVSLVWHLNDTTVPKKVASVFGLLVRLFSNKIVVAAKAVAIHYGVSQAPYEVIYAPVDTKLYGSGIYSAKDKKRNMFRILLIANWRPVKGLEYYLKAAALVRESLGDKLEIAFAGSKLLTQTDYCQYIESLIRKLKLNPYTRDYGFVSSVVNLLADSDVLILSSITEACPMVVLEAMASGVPVVATDVGGVREMLLPDTDNPAGIVVPVKSPKAMATAILELLNNSKQATSMGENGRRLAEECFSLEQCTQRHLDVYESLA